MCSSCVFSSRFAVMMGSSRIFFGFSYLGMRVEMSSLQVVVGGSRMVRGRLVMMFDSRVRCIGSHKKFLFDVDKRYESVPRIAKPLLSIPSTSIVLQKLPC